MQSLAPAPWHTDPDVNHEAVLAADGAIVADCAIFGLRVNRPAEMNRAHARLIAAAPELLGLARQFEAVVRWQIRKDQTDGDDEGARLKTVTLNIIQAAITKVEGRD